MAVTNGINIEPTEWKDGETALSAKNLNKIEQRITNVDNDLTSYKSDTKDKLDIMNSTIDALQSPVIQQGSGTNSAQGGGASGAVNDNSFAFGEGTLTQAKHQIVLGKYNALDNNALFLLGNGTGNNERSNAIKVDANGDIVITGDVSVDGNINSTGSLTFQGDDDFVKPEDLTWTKIDKKPQLKEADTNNIGIASMESTARSVNTFAVGYNTIAGGKGFTITKCSDNGDGTGTYTLSSVTDLKVDMKYSTKYNAGKIKAIDKENKTVTVDGYKHIELDTGTDDPTTFNVYNCFLLVDHPEIGDKEVGFNAHAEGENTIASNKSSHAEGYNTRAIGKFSHAEGNGSVAGHAAHAEGSTTKARGDSSHAEGFNTTTTGKGAHAEGDNNIAAGDASHTEGYSTQATANYAHAEGSGTTASGRMSHAEGSYTTASGAVSHAEGGSTTAHGYASHTEGENTTASGSHSHAGGKYAQAKHTGSFAHGSYVTTKADYQAVFGKYNTETTGLFIIGCGTSDVKQNAFRVSNDGVYAFKSINTSGADFAELFEWADGNVNNDDRRGLFVTLEGDTIRLANSGDDYIGIISGSHAFLGNSASEDWHKKYLTDVFGTKLTEEVAVPAEHDPETGELISEATITTQLVVNPEYDPTQEYVMRENRKEWGVVGLLGQLVIVDDGTCEVGGYVEPSVDGVGTKSTKGYRVMKRLDDTHIKVLVK